MNKKVITDISIEKYKKGGGSLYMDIDKDYFLDLNKTFEKNAINILIIATTIIIMTLLPFINIAILPSFELKFPEYITFSIYLIISVLFIALIFLFVKNGEVFEKRESWLIENEERLIKEEGRICEYDIIYFSKINSEKKFINI